MTKLKRNVFPLPPYLSVIFSIALIGIVIAVPWDRTRQPYFITYLFGSLGGALAVWAIPALIAVVWRLLETLFGARTNSPITVSALAFLGIGTLSLVGIRGEPIFGSAVAVSAGTFTYTNSDCKFAVDFPAKPELKWMNTMTRYGEFRYEQAFLVGSVEYLRAECVPGSIIRADLELSLKNYLDWEGVNFAAYDLSNANYVEGRGYKYVEGAKSIVVIRIYSGANSVLTALALSKSENYPSSNTINFFKSIRAAR